MDDVSRETPEQEQMIEDFAVVFAFMAVAVDQEVMFNGLTAQETWNALMRVFDFSPEQSSSLLRDMIEGE